MAVCDWCDQEMTSMVGCTAKTFHLDGQPIDRIPRGDPRDLLFPNTNPCRDCGTPSDGQHHPGCDSERCPQCDGQAISCGCRFDEDGEDPDEDT